MLTRIALAGVVAVVGALALSGCVEAEPTPTPSAVPTIHVTAPPLPELDLEGTAADNLEYFDMVNRELIAEPGRPDGRDFIDNLVEAGFPKSDMEVTRDKTAISLAADNIQFAVRINGTCLIGQFGNIGYASTATSLLSTGRCLVGDTRPINW